MRYKNINGYNISKLTLGTVQLGLNYSIQNSSSKPDIRQSFDILDFALKAGINTLDTASTYGNAEQIIGNFKEKRPDHQVNIVTKFKISDKNLHHFGQAWSEVYRSITTSLAMLRIKVIPICLFHKNKDQPMDLVMKILPEILENLIKDGLIEIGGISVYHPDELKYVLDHDIIKAIQAPMNVFDQRLRQSDLLQQIHNQQKLIFIRSLYLKGLLFMSFKDLKGSLTEAGKYLKILHDIANQSDMTVAQLAFSYVRDMKEVTSIVFGADNIKQIQQNIQLLQSKELEASTREAVENEFHNLPESIITPHLWTF
jgi:aryl-alcohol dehydrogenase-like predicted oxidoreductase